MRASTLRLAATMTEPVVMQGHAQFPSHSVVPQNAGASASPGVSASPGPTVSLGGSGLSDAGAASAAAGRRMLTTSWRTA